MKFALMLQIPSALINIVLSIYFVGFTNAGIPGVLYATVLTEILRRPFAIWYTAKIAKLNLWDYLKKGYGMALLYLATIAVPGFLVLQHRQSTDWMQLILGAIFFGIYATIVLCVVEWKLVAIILKTAWMRSRLQKA